MLAVFRCGGRILTCNLILQAFHLLSNHLDLAVHHANPSLERFRIRYSRLKRGQFLKYPIGRFDLRDYLLILVERIWNVSPLHGEDTCHLLCTHG